MLLPLAIVGCGSGSRTPAVANISETTSEATATTSAGFTPSTTGSQTQRLIVYSACMRRNGVPSFPDPTGQGNLLVTPRDDIDPTSSRYKHAQNACKKFSPKTSGGVGMTPAQHAQALAALTAYVHCMRKHGIEMADPFSGPNGGVGIALPRNLDLNSPLYKQADNDCKHLIPNGG
jgi:hypothetical protein